MILQRALKGIGGLSLPEARAMLHGGIICNWWRRANPLPYGELPFRLTERNLHWHQNRYNEPDPLEADQPFNEHTPYISLTSGTVERDRLRRCNVLHPAWQVALEFATDGWQRDGYLFYCYVFVLGRPSIPHAPFAEEIRDLNIFTNFNAFQPEGEMTAKIIVPPTQIEKLEFYSLADVINSMQRNELPAPSHTYPNTLYQDPNEISNIRGYPIWPNSWSYDQTL